MTNSPTKKKQKKTTMLSNDERREIILKLALMNTVFYKNNITIVMVKITTEP